MIKVGINGYGTIGRRVAHAVRLQKDMIVTGIVKTRPDYVADSARKDFRIFTPDRKTMEAFSQAGMDPAGTIEDLLNESDVIVDATPEGMGRKNVDLYRSHHVKAVFQGGEDHEIAQASFNAYSNFNQSWGKDYVRVVSCNTTALARTVTSVRNFFGARHISATLIRRATDPNDSSKGPINALEPSLKFPSHHAPDLKTVIGDIDVETVAIKAPTTLMHVHVVQIEIEKGADTKSVLEEMGKYSRILLVSGKAGLTSTAQIMDMARERGRDRSDLYEIAVWKESVNLKGQKLNYIQAVHQESDVVPENVDAIRAMFQQMDMERSISETDKTLNIGNRV